ncbi:MAG: ATP-binding cassette domain-containing protein [Bifidobacteriaceae bacterium]|jgi:putative ABC transport system ATP-binding protein|nr:ATP-binding cassette domain-containing protein [Bifidobacteriaceae bacterium]
MSGTPVLAGAGLTHSFGGADVLRDVDIALQPGECVAVMGPSGSGKSTLLHLLGGLLTPDAGEVWLAGRRIDRLPERRRAALRLANVGFVFQFGDLIPELTVVENVELPLRLNGAAPKEARRRALAALERLDVAAHAGKRLREVSGGQAQRAAVARALAGEPPVILADEPTGSLDTVTGELVMEALVSAAREAGTAVLTVTHELKVAAWAERDVLLRDGRVVGASAPPPRPEAPLAPAGGAVQKSRRALRGSAYADHDAIMRTAVNPVGHYGAEGARRG